MAAIAIDEMLFLTLPWKNLCFSLTSGYLKLTNSCEVFFSILYQIDIKWKESLQ